MVYIHNKFTKESVKSKKEIKRWLIKVTINECKTIFLSSWKRRIVSLTEKHENIKYEKDNDNLLNEINKLSKKERIVIFLYYYEGYKVKEIANLLGKSETNIQTILYRARKSLKDILEEER